MQNNTYILNNGVEIPYIGLGTWQINEETNCINTIKTALSLGYRLIDTASAYLNEEFIGKALLSSEIPRESLFISSKLWVQDYGYKNTLIAFEKTLKRLHTHYLDMYMLHWAVSDYIGSWKALEELYSHGKIRSIGVCNFPINELETLMKSAQIKPAINQVETHPLFQQIEMKKYLKENHIAHESWAPFSQGNTRLLHHPTLAAIAKAHNKNISQVILRWHIENGSIVIPKATSYAHLKSNIEIFDFKLTNAELQTISNLDTNHPFSVSPIDRSWLQTVENWKFDI